MVKHNILLLIVILLCSCIRETTIEEQHIIKFSVLTSRSSQEGNFEEGDVIGVFALDPKTGIYWGKNNKYIFRNNEFVPYSEEDNIVVTMGTDFDFYVYYPYSSEQIDITNIRHSISNQDTESKWIAADFMTATYTDPITNYTIPLHFTHRLSTLQVNVDENNNDVSSATIENLHYTSTYNLLTGEMNVDESVSNFKMFPYKTVEGHASVFRITLPVQEITTDNIVRLSGSTEVLLKPNNDISLNHGKIHNYNVDYRKEVTVRNYLPGGNISGAGEYIIGTTCTLNAYPNIGYNFAGWYSSEGLLLSHNKTYSFRVYDDITIESRYESFSNWSIDISADPTILPTKGGISIVTASAIRNRYVNGVIQSDTETAVPSLSSSDDDHFSLIGNEVHVKENTSEEEFVAHITASYSGSSASVTLRQPGVIIDYIFNIDGKNELMYAALSNGTSKSYNVVSYKEITTDGTVSSPMSLTWSVTLCPDWITFSESGDMSISSNPTTEIREGTIVLTQSESGNTITITVRQQGKYEIVIPPSN